MALHKKWIQWTMRCWTNSLAPRTGNVQEIILRSAASQFISISKQMKCNCPNEASYLNIYQNKLNRWIPHKWANLSYLCIMWHDLYVVRWMKPWFRGIWQEVLELAGVDICILMNVIGKWWFLSCVCKECCTKRTIKQISHARSTLTPFCIQLIKQCSVNLAFLGANHSCMNLPK